MVTRTLAKGFGIMDGYVAGSAPLVVAMRSTTLGFIFSSSMPAMMAAGARASVQHLKESQTEREAMHARSGDLKKRLVDAGFPLLPSVSHTIPLMVGDAVKVKEASAILMDNLSTSPRCRAPLPTHSEEVVEDPMAALDDVWTTLDLPRKFVAVGEYLPEVGFRNVEQPSGGFSDEEEAFA